MKTEPVTVPLRDLERHELEQRVRCGRREHRVVLRVLRAEIVLLADGGATSVEIGRRRRVVVNSTLEWRKRFVIGGLDGLSDLERLGRPNTFSAEVTAVACELPAKRNLSPCRFSSAEIAAEVVASGIIDENSASSFRRILAEAAICPWRYLS